MQTIKVILAESGRVANLKKDFPLYVGSYQNKLLNVLVPKSILAPNFTSHYIDTDGVIKSVDGAYTAVKIGMTYLERTGVIKQSTTFFMRYLKDVVINNVEYSMYERLLPKEFTLFEGQGENAPKLIVNIVNVLVETKIDNENIESIGTTLEVITSQYASIDVMYSADLNNEPEYNPSDMELLSAIVNSHTIDVETSLKNSIDALETSTNADNKAAEALLKAEDALNTVVSEKGTSVYVNNQAQLRLDFETDPQNQINNVKKDVATLQTNKADKTTVEALQTQANENVTNITELQTNKADKTMLSTPNLLINGDFAINQRGLPSYSGSNVYCVDRWKLQGLGSFDVPTKTYSTSERFSAIRQAVEDFEKYKGKTITYSVSVKSIPSGSFGINIRDGVNTFLKENITTGLNTFTVTISENATQLIFDIQGRSSGENSIQFEYAKGEQCSIATPFISRPYAEEFVMCQRYYQKYGIIAQNVQYCGTTSSLYQITLTNPLRTAPTIVKYESANIRTPFNNTEVTSISKLVASAINYTTNVNDLRLSATHSKTIEPQLTKLLVQKLEIDAEM